MPYFRTVRNKNRGRSKETDPRRNVERSKEPIRGATSPDRSKEIKGPDQTRSKEPFRDAKSEDQSSNKEASNQTTNQDKESTRK
jgi:hypothetical protein